MNVAILAFNRLGGSGIVAYDIAREMAEHKDNAIHFIGLEQPFRMAGQKPHKNIFFHKISMKLYDVFQFQPYSLALASQLAEIIKKENIEVVHAHYAIPHSVVAILAKQISGKPIRIITTLHGTDITLVGQHKSMYEITRYGIIKSDVVVAVSHALRQETESVFDLEKGKIGVIPNFVSPDKYEQRSKNNFDFDNLEGEKLLLHASNLRSVKAPLDVIRIFHRMLELGLKNARLGILGNGPLRQDMAKEAEKLGIAKKVEFFGEQLDVSAYFLEAKLFLLTSKTESFGLVILEAMASCTPVLASAVGGVVEVIDHNVNGLLFKQGDIEEAARLGLNLLLDKHAYNHMLKQASFDAFHKFPAKQVIDRYYCLYKGKCVPKDCFCKDSKTNESSMQEELKNAFKSTTF